MFDINELTIPKVQEMYHRQQISIKELVKEYLSRISKYDQGPNNLNSVLEINPDVLDIAENLDRNRSGQTSQLYGIPILLKDNIATADRMHTSAGSLALADSIPSYDADIVIALRKKGALILGKTNMTEYANFMSGGMKAGYSSRGGYVNYPYKKNEDASGSSTGSAVAVTANFCIASFGTDTTGSIISPAIRNGIVGFRPSIGTFSQGGIIPISFTLDTAGPMTRTVMDSLIILSELSNVPIGPKNIDLSEIVIGVNQSNIENLTVEEKNFTDTFVKLIEKSGAKIKPIELPVISKNDLIPLQLYEFKYAINRYLSSLQGNYSIRTLKDIIEFNNLDPDKTLRYGQSFFLDAEGKTRGDMSEPVYKQLLNDREPVKNKVLDSMKGIDICILSQNDFVMQYAGLPIISIPYGLYKDGTPFGICLTSLNNEKLLKIANKIEQLIGNRVPPDFPVLQYASGDCK